MTIVLPSQSIQTTYTALSLVQDFCVELGFDVPNTIVNSSDKQITQILRIANRVGMDLCRDYDWQRLIAQANIPTSVGVLEYRLPDNWLRSVADTAWDTAHRFPMYGSVTPQGWAAYKALTLGAGIDIFYRIMNNRIVLVANPPENDTFQFEYISKNWVITAVEDDDSGLSYQYSDKIASDTDSTMFDEDLMLEGMLLRWRKTKGLPFEERDYQNLLSKCKSQDKPAHSLSLSGRIGFRLIDRNNIPITGYGR